MEDSRCSAAVLVLILSGVMVLSYPLEVAENPTGASNTPSCNVITRLTKVLSDEKSANLCNGTAVVDYNCSPDVDGQVLKATRNIVNKLHTSGNKARVQCDFNYSDMPFGTCSVRMEVKKSEAEDGNSNEECLLSMIISAVTCDSGSEISQIQRSVGEVMKQKCSRYDK